MNIDPEEILGRLREAVRGLGSAVIAFSGGVDSALVARIASEELRGRVILVTAQSETYTPDELERAKRTASELNVPHIVAHTREIENPLFRSNPPDRCYHCKRELMVELERVRVECGYKFIADGTNTDDARDYRPGARAVREFGVRSPLAETGMSKEEVRAVSRHIGLADWDLPAAACLASRIPYGTPIEAEDLRRIGEAEKFLTGLTGIKQLRLRHHGTLARIEVPANEIERLAGAEVRGRAVDALRSLGYHYVTLDLTGYRTGSMNEVLLGSNSEKNGGADVGPE
jgi:pyridinium-3,5-biscarboxylic acid mononucleotide sulfurtransferase